MVFSAINKAPGVYIDEVQLLGPIAGVSTSIAAFVGPAKAGPINTPVFMTNWTQFINTFGVLGPDGQFDPYMTNPDRFAAHAVRGFFDNGGTMCYFVRVSKATAAFLNLSDRSGGQPPAALKITARTEGSAGNNLIVNISDAHIATTSIAWANVIAAPPPQIPPLPAQGSNEIFIAAADRDRFVIGDNVVVSDPQDQEPATIKSIGKPIANTHVKIELTAALSKVYAAGRVQYAVVPGQTSFRVNNVAGIERGTYLTITQNPTNDFGIVYAANPITRLVTLSRAIQSAYDSRVNVSLQSQEFDLDASGTRVPNLSLDSRHSRYFANIVKSVNLPVNVDFPDVPNPTPPPNNLPLAGGPWNLANGQGEIAPLDESDFLKSLAALEQLEDVNLLCVPDCPDGPYDPAIQLAMIDQCERLKDRFAIIDPHPTAVVLPMQNTPQIDIVTGQRERLASDRGYGALYFPQLVIKHPVYAGQLLTIPPCGHLAGMFARTDSDKGVHKAPANERLSGPLAVEHTLGDGEQGPLNEKGVNVIRAFKNRGIICFGGRTISTSTQWRYVSTRRLLIFIEKSIQLGTQFAVFEPNGLPLWQQIKRAVNDFLKRVWKDGALFGATPEQAFRVKVDEELNPPDVRALGQLVAEVVVLPTFPAEFIVFRIIQDPTGAALSEQ